MYGVKEETVCTGMWGLTVLVQASSSQNLPKYLSRSGILSQLLIWLKDTCFGVDSIGPASLNVSLLPASLLDIYHQMLISPDVVYLNK